MRRAVTGLLGWFAVLGLGVGGGQAPAPASFHEDFPGPGRHWGSVDGPYDEHLLRDVGPGNLAIGVVALVALLTAMAFRLPAVPAGRPAPGAAGRTGRSRTAFLPGPGTRPPSPRGEPA